MKKIIIISIVAVLMLVMPLFVLAQENQRGQAKQQKVKEKASGIETAVQKLNRITERNNNPETGEQIRSMVQNHKKVQTRTKTALSKMDKRNKAVKLMIGPDYKNAGQVRKDVVGLRNDIRKLEQIKKKSLPADVGDIQGALDELQAEADGLENKLAEQLSGFSLFGWLAKLFAN